jgi:hypothetical protein
MADYEYFTKNLKELYAKYGHKFIVIKNEEVIGAYDTFDVAFDTTMQTEELGTFIIQECVSDPTELVQSFQGNVTFANEAIAV